MAGRSFTPEGLIAYLKATGVCNITGVGKLKVVQRQERQGTNPLTKQPITIAAKKAATFTPAKALKEALNG